MELTDVLSKEAWAAFERELFDRFQINCAVFNASGVAVTGKPNWCNRLCPKIKAHKESLAAICAPSNQHFMAQAKQTRQAVLGECDAGLFKIAVPIFKDGEFLGTAGGCGLRPEGGEIEAFLVEKTTHLDEADIAALCDDLGTMTGERAREMADFIEKRIAQLMAKIGAAAKLYKAVA